jgi:hypothetical protein
MKKTNIRERCAPTVLASPVLGAVDGGNRFSTAWNAFRGKDKPEAPAPAAGDRTPEGGSSRNPVTGQETGAGGKKQAGWKTQAVGFAVAFTGVGMLGEELKGDPAPASGGYGDPRYSAT